MTLAPWSPDIYSDGWRLRVGGGYGQYSYDRGVPIAVTAAHSRLQLAATVRNMSASIILTPRRWSATPQARPADRQGICRRLDVLRTTRKVAEEQSDGTEYGAKGVLELWLNMDAEAWTSVDFSYATNRNETSSRWRAGWRVQPRLSVGPELRYDKNIESGDGE